MDKKQEEINAIPNLLDVFVRNGRQIYLEDMRTVLFPRYVVLLLASLTGVIIVYLPLLMYMVLTGILYPFFHQVTFTAMIVPLSSYWEHSLYYLVLFAVLGPLNGLLRRFCVAHNLAFEKQVDADKDFRVGGDEISLALLFTGVFMLIFEEVRFLNIFIFFFSLFISMAWIYIHNILLSWYAFLFDNKKPQKLFALWNYLRVNDIVMLSSIKKIGLRNNEQTLVLEGDFSEEDISRLKEEVVGQIGEIEELVIK